MLAATVPEFARYSDKFLEVYAISAASASRNYELIVETIMNHPHIPLDQKVKLVIQHENARVENCLKMQEKVVEGMKVVGGVAIRLVLNTLVKKSGRNSRSLGANLLRR